MLHPFFPCSSFISFWRQLRHCHTQTLSCACQFPRLERLYNSPLCCPVNHGFLSTSSPCRAAWPSLLSPACLELMCPESVESEKCSRHSVLADTGLARSLTVPASHRNTQSSPSSTPKSIHCFKFLCWFWRNNFYYRFETPHISCSNLNMACHKNLTFSVFKCYNQVHLPTQKMNNPVKNI